MAATLSWPGGLELKMAWDGSTQTALSCRFLMKHNPFTNTGSGQTKSSMRKRSYGCRRTGPMTTNGGADVPLASHMRYDNPYVAEGGVSFPLRGAVRFAVDGKALELDFDKGVRRTVSV
jgi:hypothetical protein